MTSLEDAFQDSSRKFEKMLSDGIIGHVDASNELRRAGYPVSESAVRRWRRNNNIILKPGPLQALPEAVEAPQDGEESREYLRKEVIRLGKALEKEKTAKSEYVEAVYSAVRDVIAEAEQEESEIGARWSDTELFNFYTEGDGEEEVAVALVSDLQLAKVSRKGDKILYNSAIAEERMLTYAKKILSITRIQREDHPVNKLVIPVLGDIIEGEEIFPGQMWLLDGGLYRQITVDGPRIIVNFIRTLIPHFKEIEVVWVIGNHGRIGGTTSRNHDPETNGDRMLGQICKLILEPESRVNFRVADGPGESNWFDFVEIGNYRALCIHGNQIPGGQGLPFNGIVRKVNSWAAGAIEEPFQDVYMGHYHTRGVIPVNKRNVYINGSTESYNTYAQEVIGALSEPSQWLLFVHPERGRVTASYGVELT